MAILPPVNSAFGILTPPVVLSLHEMIEGNRSVEEIASAINPLEINLKRNGKTPFILAIQRGDPLLIRMLLERGGDSTIQTDDGRSALYIASVAGKLEAVKILISAGANIKKTNEAHQATALHAAAAEGHVHVIQELLSSSNRDVKFIDQQTTDGCTALYLAAQKGHFLAAKELLENYASMDVASKEGIVAFDIARRGWHYKISNLILNAKSNMRLYGYRLPLATNVVDYDQYDWKLIDYLTEYGDMPPGPASIHNLPYS